MASIKKRTIRWQTKDGQERTGERWQARYRDEAGKEHAKMFRRKVDAQQWLDEITASIVTGQYVDPKAGKVTFQRFYADWSARQVWVPSTRVNSDRAAASVPFSDMPMKAIRKSHVELFVKRMSADGLAASTIKTRFVMLRAVMRGAVADRIIPADPTIGVRLPRQAKREDSWSLPTEDQVGALVEKARPEFRAFVALCAFAGLRSGEACGVQVGDIDFLRRELHIRRQIQGDSREMAIRAPKYGSSRIVFLSDELVTILSEHVAAHTPDGEADRWLFTIDGEKPLDGNAVTYRWSRARTAAKAKTVRLHDLRHFFASGLIAEGCDVVTVQRALGHSSATTTLNTYSHLWPSAEDRTRKASASLIRSSLGILADSTRTVGR